MSQTKKYGGMLTSRALREHRDRWEQVAEFYRETLKCIRRNTFGSILLATPSAPERISITIGTPGKS
ncbi:MAG TPA: hypothetical protein VGW77_27890 [Candidatus Binatia bacterium]|jgi:hypothetical protein|nr:hypothetical protein [Candidatus Binatia bacterium]